ncbi:MAG: hypothetical protein ABSA18_16500, partial [Dehalococcoidia bacterium]
VGSDDGKGYVIKHIDEYAHIIKPVTYDEVVKFVGKYRANKSAKTDNLAVNLKENANREGIKCACAFVQTYDTELLINAFDTTDKGIVYLEATNNTFFNDKKELQDFIELVNSDKTPKGSNVYVFGVSYTVGKPKIDPNEIYDIRIIW